MKYFVYVLQSLVAKKSHVGITDNMERRLKQHNGSHHFYTKRYIPWSVLHTEQYATLTEARAREKYLKSAAGRRFLKEHIFNI